MRIENLKSIYLAIKTYFVLIPFHRIFSLHSELFREFRISRLIRVRIYYKLESIIDDNCKAVSTEQTIHQFGNAVGRVFRKSVAGFHAAVSAPITSRSKPYGVTGKEKDRKFAASK